MKIHDFFEISCPAKTFVLGEYGVLDGGPAVLINTEPRFRCLVSRVSRAKNSRPFSVQNNALRQTPGQDEGAVSAPAAALPANLLQANLLQANRSAEPDSAENRSAVMRSAESRFVAGRVPASSAPSPAEETVAGKLLRADRFAGRNRFAKLSFAKKSPDGKTLSPKKTAGGSEGALSFAGFPPADSPAGRWLSHHKEVFRDLSLKWTDPFCGRGGLGFSSAQFVILYACRSLLRRGFLTVHPQEVWRAYRKAARPSSGLRPSGADIVSQWTGGLCLFQQNPLRIRSFTLPLPLIECLIVRAGGPFPTHGHLKSLKQSNVSLFKEIAEGGVSALEAGDETVFLQAVNEYRKALDKENRTAEHTKTLLKEFAGLEEVKALKGCGAMGAETVILFYEKEREKSLREKLSRFEILTDSSKITCGVASNRIGGAAD